MIVIAVVNSKGGVGKTTLTTALAIRAAQDRQAPRVCIADLDPQKSLVEWWKRRGRSSNPMVLENVDSAVEAVERAELAGYDFCFLDGPPAFLTTLQEMVEASHFVVIPVKPSVADMLATEDAVILTREAGTPFTVVFNDVLDRDRRIADKAREALFNAGVPIAKTVIHHRASYILGLNAGKSAAEVNSGKDTKAADEINALWLEVRAQAQKSARARQSLTAGAPIND